MRACRKVHHTLDIEQRYSNKQLELKKDANLLATAKQWRLIGTTHFVVHNYHAVVNHSSDVVVVVVAVAVAVERCKFGNMSECLVGSCWVVYQP